MPMPGLARQVPVPLWDSASQSSRGVDLGDVLGPPGFCAFGPRGRHGWADCPGGCPGVWQHHASSPWCWASACAALKGAGQAWCSPLLPRLQTPAAPGPRPPPGWCPSPKSFSGQLLRAPAHGWEVPSPLPPVPGQRTSEGGHVFPEVTRATERAGPADPLCPREAGKPGSPGERPRFRFRF